MDDSQMLHLFGRRVRLARRRAALSQEDLGRRLGVGQDTISHYETGQCRPDFTIVWRLALILHVEVGYFFPDDRLAMFCPDEQDTLALLRSLSPLALTYVLTFVRSFTERQQRHHFLRQNVLVMEPDQALFHMLERELYTLETPVTPGKITDEALMELLVGFTSLLLMSAESPDLKADIAEMLHRVVRQSQRGVRQLVTAKNRAVRA